MRTLTLALACATCLATSAQAAEQWLLMARHGECADIAALKRKVPELGEVRDPDAFEALMRKQGFAVTAAEIPAAKGKVREVKVPAKELSLLFATPEACKTR